MPVVGMAGGSGITFDGAEQQRVSGVIVYNGLRSSLLISQPPDH